MKPAGLNGERDAMMYKKYIKELNKNYKNILVLDKLLVDRNIPHHLFRIFDGYQILYYDRNHIRRGDVVTHKYSYGSQNDLMEAYGFTECGDSVIGDLSVNEALNLFINAWEEDNNAERIGDGSNRCFGKWNE